jgi:hypothetical protein
MKYPQNISVKEYIRFATEPPVSALSIPAIQVME